MDKTKTWPIIVLHFHATGHSDRFLPLLMSGPEYRWRKLTATQQAELLCWRKLRGHPWHSPPHIQSPGRLRYHLTAACYEHRPIIDAKEERIQEFATSLLGVIQDSGGQVHAWVVLPNHYHLLLQSSDILALIQTIGRFHGRTAFEWNREDNARGRRVFFRAMERSIRSDGHYWATMNYIHHNPVHHRYTKCWTDWPWSSANQFVQEKGRENAERIWREYPITTYGQGWDDPEL